MDEKLNASQQCDGMEKQQSGLSVIAIAVCVKYERQSSASGRFQGMQAVRLI